MINILNTEKCVWIWKIKAVITFACLFQKIQFGHMWQKHYKTLLHSAQHTHIVNDEMEPYYCSLYVIQASSLQKKWNICISGMATSSIHSLPTQPKSREENQEATELTFMLTGCQVLVW
jgi:hypothetical protein